MRRGLAASRIQASSATVAKPEPSARWVRVGCVKSTTCRGCRRAVKPEGSAGRRDQSGVRCASDDALRAARRRGTACSARSPGRRPGAGPTAVTLGSYRRLAASSWVIEMRAYRRVVVVSLVVAVLAAVTPAVCALLDRRRDYRNSPSNKECAIGADCPSGWLCDCVELVRDGPLRCGTQVDHGRRGYCFEDPRASANQQTSHNQGSSVR
jgi:hypothetical protein